MSSPAAKGSASARLVYPAVALVGALTFIAIFGWGHLVGDNAYWHAPTPDERMYLIGYRYLLHEPWHWPLLTSHAIDVPYTASLAYWDCIPIWGLINKLVATVIPPWAEVSARAYLGVWHALGYALQACGGVAVMRALGHTRWPDAVIAAVFFLAVPAWIARYWHDALSAQCFELFAIALYVRTPDRARMPTRLGVAWIGLAAIAAMVTPYHPVMVLGVLVAATLRARDPRWLVGAVFSVAATTWLAGYVARGGVRPQWGFEYESANALSWLVPTNGGILGDALWLANVRATDWQYEGYAYLGLGALALLVFACAHPRDVRAAIARHRWLFAAAIAFGVLALSNRIFVGGYQLLRYPIPHVLHWFPAQFRSPGRFVWIPMYVALIYALHVALRRARSPRGLGLLALALALQVWDASGDWAAVRSAMQAYAAGRVLPEQPWRELVHAHRAMTIEPSFNCVDNDANVQHVNEVAIELAMLASERGMPLNGTYNTRALRRCAPEAAAWTTATLEPAALYIVLPKARALADQLRAQGARCAAFADGVACSADAPAIDRAIAQGILRAE